MNVELRRDDFSIDDDERCEENSYKSGMSHPPFSTWKLVRRATRDYFYRSQPLSNDSMFVIGAEFRTKIVFLINLLAERCEYKAPR